MNNLGVFLEGQQKFDEAERALPRVPRAPPRNTRTASSHDTDVPL